MRHCTFLFVLLLWAIWAPGQTSDTSQSNPPATASDTPYHGMTGKERLSWLVKSTVGPRSLAAGVFTSTIGPAQDNPREYGPGWEGFGTPYGLRLSGIGTSHTIEAGLG